MKRLIVIIAVITPVLSGCAVKIRSPEHSDSEGSVSYGSVGKPFVSRASMGLEKAEKERKIRSLLREIRGD